MWWKLNLKETRWSKISWPVLWLVLQTTICSSWWRTVDSWEVNIDCGTTQEETLANEIMEICIQRIGMSKHEKVFDHHPVDVHECLDTRPVLVQVLSVSQEVIEVESAGDIVIRNFVSNPKECAPKKISMSETLLNLAQPNDKKRVHENVWGSSSGHSVKKTEFLPETDSDHQLCANYCEQRRRWTIQAGFCLLSIWHHDCCCEQSGILESFWTQKFGCGPHSWTADTVDDGAVENLLWYCRSNIRGENVWWRHHTENHLAESIKLPEDGRLQV
jgi:hypothetical protein